MGDSGKCEVIVAGAGLAGALMAARLGRLGYQVSVYERRDDPRETDQASGRSINLAISERGLHALDQVGLKENILEIAVPMYGRMMHTREGALRYQPYGTQSDQAINSVSRGLLNLRLIEAAAGFDNVSLHFGQKCCDLDVDVGRLSFEDTQSGETKEAQTDVVVGADGAFSAVRSAMQRMDRFDYAQSYLAHGYKELTIPPADGGGHRLEKNVLHIWPRKSFMMIALPNLDGSFTCTLFFPFEGPLSFASLRTDDDVTRFFETELSDAVPLMPALLEDFASNPTSSLVTVRCGPWYHADRAVLVGDACHAVVPFYGQGANAAFEDCTVLGDRLAASNGNRAEVFRSYYKARKRHVDTLADLAIANFIEMRDHTDSVLFLWKKKLEKSLHKLFPRWFLPLYSMVTFSRIPYGDAVDRDRKQWRTVRLSCIALLILVVLLVMGVVL